MCKRVLGFVAEVYGAVVLGSGVYVKCRDLGLRLRVVAFWGLGLGVEVCQATMLGSCPWCFHTLA